MEYILLKPNSDEWERMWKWVEEHPINSDIVEPSIATNDLNGECWQYIGSFRGSNGTLISEIRHRSHPLNNERYIISYQHENEVDVSNIDQIIPIK